MVIRIAIAHVADSRDDYFSTRKPLLEEELQALDWMRAHAQVLDSPILRSTDQVRQFAEKVQQFGAHGLIIHLPIWADPVLSVKLHSFIDLPILLVGNGRPDTSSTVGLLGAGGALDQIGANPVRVFDHKRTESRKKVLAFVRAAGARQQLRGQTLGLFGGRSLGIFTAGADATQWQRIFGVDIEYVDQLEIRRIGEELEPEEVIAHTGWLLDQVGSVKYGGIFSPEGLDRQMRSYIATSKLVDRYDFDFVGVKCQRELSDGYASQCVSHMLMNGVWDAGGQKPAMVHACESDADGALTMQILNLLSGGKPTALLDIRWLNEDTGYWTLANCGAIAASFFATEKDAQGYSSLQLVPHVFGEGGGGSFSGFVSPQRATLARLCRRNGEYWMAIVPAEIQQVAAEQLERTTSAFPQVVVKAAAGYDFLEKFGSNHIHMVSGDYADEVIAFCRLLDIPYQIWD